MYEAERDGGAGEWEERLHTFSTCVFPRLTRFSRYEQPDVICFQESFSSRVSNRIIGKTLTSYPYKVIEPIPIPPSLPLLGNTLQMNSGLCIVSKFPITSCTAKAYGTSCGADYQANKGVICATLDVGGGRTVKVVTTHMQSDPCNDPLWWCTSKPYESARDVKAEQLGVLSSVASKALEEGKKEKGFKGVLVCGDLNVPGEVRVREERREQL